MLERLGRLASITLIIASTFALPVKAEETDASTVVATVNGTEITVGHMIALRSSLPSHYSQFPADVLFEGILDQLVQQTLLMQSYEGTPSRYSQVSIENETRAIVAGEVIDRVMNVQIDEPMLLTAYSDKYSDPADRVEYSAAHILVDTKEEAEALIAELHGDADFATLAREHSTGPSGPSGGDLGWFAEGRMVAPFFDAVVTLEPGQVSAPTKTEFGWHVIKLNETRTLDQPEFETVRTELEEELRTKTFGDFVGKLENAATITLTETDGVDPAIINRIELLEN